MCFFFHRFTYICLWISIVLIRNEAVINAVCVFISHPCTWEVAEKYPKHLLQIIIITTCQSSNNHPHTPFNYRIITTTNLSTCLRSSPSVKRIFFWIKQLIVINVRSGEIRVFRLCGESKTTMWGREKGEGKSWERTRKTMKEIIRREITKLARYLVWGLVEERSEG